MESQTNELTLRDIVQVIARRRWLVIGAVLLCAALAAVLSLVQTPVYSATAEVLVQSRAQDLFQNQTGTLSDRSIQTEIQLMEGQTVRERVRQDLGLDELPPEVSALAVPSTDVISMVVSDADANDAARYANAYATAYVDVRREQVVKELLAARAAVEVAIDDIQADIDALDDGELSDSSIASELANFPSRTALAEQLAEFSTTLTQLGVDAALRTGGATIITIADAPTSPKAPTPARTIAIAVAIGLLLGLAAAFLVDYLDDKIRTEDDLASLVPFPVFANVPVDSRSDNRPIALSDPGHTSVEAYRDLRTNLHFLGLDRDVRVIHVTSSTDAEGKTTVATNLAVVLAQAGHRVALVDASLRRPRLHEVLGVPQTPGFTDLLLGADANDIVHDIGVDDTNTLSAYTSGAVPSNPGELLSGQRTRQLLTDLGARFDYVIVDSSPVLAVSDAAALSGCVDAVLLVVQAGRTRRNQLTESLGRLGKVAAPVVGIVLNQTRPSAPAAVTARKLRSDSR